MRHIIQSFPLFCGTEKKSVLRKFIRDARRKGGMPVDEEGVPRRTYTNQSETVNSMLSNRKQVLGYSKKDDLSKTQFIRNIWEPVVALQDSEIE